MKRILITDVETTGIDASMDSIVEIGAIIFDLEHACSIECWSTLVRSTSNAAEAINRIPAAALVELDEDRHGLERMRDGLRAAAAEVDALVAYNCEFDRAFIERANDGPLHNVLGDPVPWICAMNDIPWPRGSSSKALTSVALAHDLGIGHAHRALADCELIARLLTRADELGEMLPMLFDNIKMRASQPKVRIVALVSFDDRDKAKGAGFSWSATRKQWERQMVLEEASALPFKWVVAA